LIDVIIGILFGMVTAFLPGVHINTFVFLFSSVLTSESTLIGIGLFSVVGILPSIFIGVPDADTIGSFFPIQRFMAEGGLRKGIFLIILSSILSALLSSLLINIFPTMVVDSYFLIQSIIPFILAFFIGYNIFTGSWGDRVVIILSSVFGFILFNLPTEDVLLPTFAGLFAIPFLLASFNKETTFPRQIKQKTQFPIVFVLIGIVLGIFAAVLPAVSSPAQLAVVATPFIQSSEAFLVLSTAILVSKHFFALSMKTDLGKPRIGAYNFIEIPEFGWLFLLFGVIVGAFILYIILNKITKIQIKRNKIQLISSILIAYLFFLTFIFHEWIGLIILICATSLGLLSNTLNSKKTNLMNVIIGPTFLRFIL